MRIRELSVLMKQCMPTVAALVLAVFSNSAECQPKSAAGVGAPGAAQTADTSNPLGADTRLSRLITLRLDNITIERALAEISELTGVKCAAAEASLRTTPIAFRFKDTPLRGAMQAIALLDRWQWQRYESCWLLKHAPDPHVLDMLRPHSDAEAELHQLGKQFLDQYNALSGDDQSRLAFNPAAGSTGGRAGMLFNQLPGAMQDTVRGLLGAASENFTSAYGRLSPVSLADLASSTVDIQRTGSSDGANQYSVDISNGNATLSASFPVFADPGEDHHVVAISDVHTPSPYDGGDVASRRDAMQHDARLSRNISLVLKRATIVEALQQLGVKAGVPFAGMLVNNDAGEVRHDVKLANVTVGDALDKLMAMYTFTTSGHTFQYSWGESKARIVTLHVMEDPPSVR